MTQKSLTLLATGAMLFLVNSAQAKVVFVEDSEYVQPFEQGKNGVDASTIIHDYGAYPWVDNTTVVGWYAIVDDDTPSEYKASNGNTQEGAPGIFLLRKAGKSGALGTMRESSNKGFTAMGLELSNDTDSTITEFAVSYLGQQWQHNSGGADKLVFQYSTDASSLDTGKWTTVDSLTFNSLVDSGPNDYIGLATTSGVLSETISGKVTDLQLKSGESIWFRWVDENNKGTDQALSIDSVSIRPTLSK